MKRYLMDTGPLIAYVSQRDYDHEYVAERLGLLEGECCTTSAVITEAMHLLEHEPQGPAALVEILVQLQAKVFECTAMEELTQGIRLMQKYADVPMDFADATLVLLADKLEATEICTLDRRGFRVYRTLNAKAFRLVLDSM